MYTGNFSNSIIFIFKSKRNYNIYKAINGYQNYVQTKTKNILK